MDALPIEETLDVPYKSRNPGVKHACGHDVHMTVALGTATVLSKMRKELPGTVLFVFQPAEEGAPAGEEGGAQLMLKEGVFNDPAPRVIFGLHVTAELPAGKVGYAPGAAMASSDSFKIRIVGKGSHAAYPHDSVDPIVTASEAVLALQTIRSRNVDPVKPLVITVGTIRAGTRSNIIPDDVTMEGTVRTLDEDVRERIPGLMRRVLDGVTRAHGASYEFEWNDGYPVTFNNIELAGRSAAGLARTLGAGNVMVKSPAMGAEDFSFFARKVPGFYYWLGVANAEKGITAGIHTAAFDADETALLVGVKAMSNLVFDELERAQ